MAMRAGLRLKSVTCDTEVIVTRATGVTGTLTCGGQPMTEPDQDVARASGDGLGEGTALGKRYTDAAGALEVLCTKQGEGSLALDGEILVIKGVKPLPSSD